MRRGRGTGLSYSLGGLPINVLSKLGQLLIRLLFFFERLLEQGDLLVLAQQFGKCSYPL